ncbi:MAG: hypothetical protein ACR2M7_04370 [Bdellovibrionales bacterium]
MKDKNKNQDKNKSQNKDKNSRNKAAKSNLLFFGDYFRSKNKQPVATGREELTEDSGATSNVVEMKNYFQKKSSTSLEKSGQESEAKILEFPMQIKKEDQAVEEKSSQEMLAPVISLTNYKSKKQQQQKLSFKTQHWVAAAMLAVFSVTMFYPFLDPKVAPVAKESQESLRNIAKEKKISIATYLIQSFKYSKRAPASGGSMEYANNNSISMKYSGSQVDELEYRYKRSPNSSKKEMTLKDYVKNLNSINLIKGKPALPEDQF